MDINISADVFSAKGLVTVVTGGGSGMWNLWPCDAYVIVHS